MIWIWFVLLSISGLFAASINRNDYSGEKAIENQFPFLVSLRVPSEKELGFFEHVCGATILSDRIILTAAHCLEDYHPVIENVRISVGAHTRLKQGKLYEIEQFIVHPDNDWALNDVAVLRLKNPIVLNENTTTIVLGRDLIEAGEKAIMVGWGYSPIIL